MRIILVTFVLLIYGGLNAQIRFKNMSTYNVEVCIAYWKNNTWYTQAWFLVDAGAEGRLTDEKLMNQYFYVYVRTRDSNGKVIAFTNGEASFRIPTGVLPLANANKTRGFKNVASFRLCDSNGKTEHTVIHFPSHNIQYETGRILHQFIDLND